MPGRLSTLFPPATRSPIRPRKPLQSVESLLAESSEFSLSWMLLLALVLPPCFPLSSVPQTAHTPLPAATTQTVGTDGSRPMCWLSQRAGVALHGLYILGITPSIPPGGPSVCLLNKQEGNTNMSGFLLIQVPPLSLISHAPEASGQPTQRCQRCQQEAWLLGPLCPIGGPGLQSALPPL